MTAAELLALDPGDLNVLLEVALGAEKAGDCHRKFSSFYRMVKRPGQEYWHEARDFCSDHNAVAAVRAGFHGNTHPSATTDKEKAYRDALCRVMGCAWYQSARLLCATPREMTVALILCLSDQ